MTWRPCYRRHGCSRASLRSAPFALPCGSRGRWQRWRQRCDAGQTDASRREDTVGVGRRRIEEDDCVVESYFHGPLARASPPDPSGASRQCPAGRHCVLPEILLPNLPCRRREPQAICRRLTHMDVRMGRRTWSVREAPFAEGLPAGAKRGPPFQSCWRVPSPPSPITEQVVVAVTYAAITVGEMHAAGGARQRRHCDLHRYDRRMDHVAHRHQGAADLARADDDVVACRGCTCAGMRRAGR